jgi:hypothetical protein
LRFVAVSLYEKAEPVVVRDQILDRIARPVPVTD